MSCILLTWYTLRLESFGCYTSPSTLSTSLILNTTLLLLITSWKSHAVSCVLVFAYLCTFAQWTVLSQITTPFQLFKFVHSSHLSGLSLETTWSREPESLTFGEMSCSILDILLATDLYHLLSCKSLESKGCVLLTPYPQHQNQSIFLLLPQ